MASGKGWDENMDINSGNNWDHGKMLRYYIYNTLKKEGFHLVADLFAREEKLDMFEVVEVDENLLAEWWESFWPRFCSGPAKPIIEDAMDLLASMKKSGATSSQQIPSRIGQCLAGKQPGFGEIECSSHVPAAFLLHMHKEAQTGASILGNYNPTLKTLTNHCHFPELCSLAVEDSNNLMTVVRLFRFQMFYKADLINAMYGTGVGGDILGNRVMPFQKLKT